MRAFSSLVPMRPRDPAEPHRVASSLELFFDLTFVIAVSTASGQLHHALTTGHVLHGLSSYLVVFFGIWWAWMNFTWFATSFDTDDWLYRVTTFVQMAGVLVLASGIEPAFHGDFRVLVWAYVVMRVAMVAQWVRAAAGSVELRRTALTYAAGIAGVQCLWLAWLLVPQGPARTVALVVLVLAEVSVPVVAERGRRTPWHPHHITERYSLFTLILLGESLLASANAVIGALHADADLAPLLATAAMVLVATASMWWYYFWPPHHRAFDPAAPSLRSSLRYGYLHVLVFAAAGAFSAGVEVDIDRITGDTVLGDTGASFAVAVPIAVFLLAVWWIAVVCHTDGWINVAVPVAALVVLLDPLLPLPMTVTTLVLVLLVVGLVASPPARHDEPGETLGAPDAGTG